MRKTLILLSMIVLGVLTVSSVAFGFDSLGEGHGARSHETCILETLTDEEQEALIGVKSDYQDLLAELREKMREMREDGNYEGFQEAKAEFFELKEERRENLSQIVPEEYKSRFDSSMRQERHNGWEKGSSGFDKQGRNLQEQ